MKKSILLKVLMLIFMMSTVLTLTVACSFESISSSESNDLHVHVWNEATCTVPQSCDCGKTQGEALGHTEVVDEAVAPDCVNTGLTEGKHCSVCGEVLVAQEVVDALGHTEVVDSAVAPDCTNSGLTEGKHCSVCSEVLVEQNVVDALGHSFADLKCTECFEWDYAPLEYFTFTLLSDDTYEIKVKDKNNIPEEIVIPIEYEEKEISIVTGFDSCVNLIKVVIPNGIKRIGSGFAGCSSLTSVVIGDSVTSIGQNAFRGCSSLTSVIIGDSVASIGYYAFYGCSLTSIVIPNSVTSIDDYAFSGCYKLVEVINQSSSITVKKGDTSNGHVGYYALSVSNRDSSYVSKLSHDSGCIIYTDGEENLLVCYEGYQTDLILPSYITKINQYAFHFSSLTSIEIPNSVTSIGDSAFRSCYSLTSVVIGASVTSIGDYAFAWCRGLTSIEIPNSVITIDNSAFYDCYSLISVVIGDSVTSIGADAFNGCCKLVEVINKSSSITVKKSSTANGYIGYYALSVSNCDSSYVSKLSNEGGYIIYTVGEERVLVSYQGTKTDLILPSYISKINQYAFSNCDSLISVVFDNMVTSIGRNAFV